MENYLKIKSVEQYGGEVIVLATVNDCPDAVVGAVVIPFSRIVLLEWGNWSAAEDLRRAGIDPESEEGIALLGEWRRMALEVGCLEARLLRAVREV